MMHEVERAIREILHGMENVELRMAFVNRVFTIMKMDENEKCWCGSGNLISECHWIRNEVRPVLIDEQIGKRIKIFSSKKLCSAKFHREKCEKTIVSAHTIQRNGVLNLMAESGHVGSLYQQLGKVTDIKNIKRGVKNAASIFHGFCSLHDRELFKCIETIPVVVEAECLWASSYRAVCHEHYQKQAAIEGTKAQMDFADIGMPLPWQVVEQDTLRYRLEQQKLGLTFIKTIKQRFEEFFDRPQGNLLGWLIAFDGPPKLAVSGTFSPFYSLDGKLIQGKTLTDNLEHFAISTVIYDGKAAWIIACLPEQRVVTHFLEDLLSRDHNEIMAILSWVIFGWNENVYFPISWWENLSQVHKEALLELAQNTNCSIPYENQAFPSSVIDQRIQRIIPFPR